MAVLVDLKTLMKKLNPTLTVDLESAIAMCMSNSNYEITLDHWLYKILSNENNTDLKIMLENYDIDATSVVRKLELSIKNFETGNTGKPLFSPFLLDIIQDAWTLGSLQFNCEKVRSGFVLLALLNNKSILSQINLFEDFRMMSKSSLSAGFETIVFASLENTYTKKNNSETVVNRGDSALDKYCENLTQKALDGKIDPIFGREQELDQMLDIFCRRRKNNPILVGEPGVGKTAVVEGLALRIAEGDVPEVLKNTDILSLDLSLLEAGASVKGEFEKRLSAVIEEVKASEKPLIIFIDEAHRLVGAGGQAGNDAANILKPALSRGEFRTVAATTWKEYKQYFEKDPALTRRFQLVKLDVPNDDTTLTILRGLKSKYTESHGVTIRDDALKMAVSLASKYITGKNQPDKSIDVIDTCAARVKVSMSATPSVIRHTLKEVSALERELSALNEDKARGVTIESSDIQIIKEKISTLNANVTDYEIQWQKEKEVIAELQEVQKQLIEKQDDAGLIVKREEITAKLKDIQKDSPIVFFEISPDTVAKVISDWTGVPLGKVLRDETQSLLKLNDTLGTVIKGQNQAIEQVSKYLKMAKAGLKDPEQPIGVFLLVGPSGVGKTETAITVAETMFGSQASICTINMSEFQEKHSISRLIGSPPGYVGFGEGGVLTEAVRQRPYSVVLLDEVEKASLDVMNLFYQVFDKGVLSDGEGKIIDFSNTVIFLTSNLATEEITNLTVENPDIEIDELLEFVRPILSKWFKPALLARTTIVPFNALAKSALCEIAKIKMDKLVARIKQTNGIDLIYSNKVIDNIASRCKEVETGARNIDIIIKSNVLPKLSEMLLMQMCDNDGIEKICIDVDQLDNFVYTV